MDGSFQDVSSMDGFGASPDGLGATLRMLGDDTQQPLLVDNRPAGFKRALAISYSIASVAGAGLGAYHGYKRNDSVGWAILWSLLGAAFPVVTIPVALAQGLGKPPRGRR